MSGIPRLVLIVLVALVLVGLVAYARGDEHHRGPQQVGALGHVTVVGPG